MNITTRAATVVSITALTCLFSGSKASSDDESWDGEKESSCESETALTLTYENHHHRLSVEAAEEFASPSFTAELESSLCHDFENALSAFTNVKLTATQEKFEGDVSSKTDEFAELDQLWLQWSPAQEQAFALRMGRQSIVDSRGWWWDDELNAITLLGSSGKVDYFAGLASSAEALRTHSPPDDPELDGINWFLSSMHYRPNNDSQVDLYLAARQDQSSAPAPGQVVSAENVDEQDDDLRWVGLDLQQWFHLRSGDTLRLQALGAVMGGTLNRLVLIEDEDEDEVEGEDGGDGTGSADDEEEEVGTGSIFPNETTTVSHQESTEVDAWALATWLHWTPAMFENHTLSVGYSIGSGTESGKKVGSGTFLQTGLQSNELDNQYYGDILDPGLSNLRIATVQLSGLLLPRIHYALTHHRYSRDSLADLTLDTNLEFELSPAERDLGHESSLNLKLKTENDLEARIGIARLITENNTDSGARETIDYIEIEVSFEF